jgi:cytochrome P450
VEPASIPLWPFPADDPLVLPLAYERLRATEDAAEVELSAGGTAFLVTRHDLVVELLRKPELSARPHAVGYPASNAAALSVKRAQRAMVRKDAPEQVPLRRAALKAIRRRTDDGLHARIAQITDEQVAAAAEAGTQDVCAGLAAAIPVAVMAETMGVPVEDAGRLAELAFDVAGLTAHGDGDPMDDVARYFAGRLDDAGIIGDIRASLHADGVESEDVVAHTVAHVFTSGLSTVRNTIALSLLALARFPDELTWLYAANDEDLRGATDELLRYTCAPRFSVLRATTEEVQIGSRTVPVHTGVIASIAAANRDPREFESPERLSLARATNRHLTFAPGTHGCIGGTVASLELQLTLAALRRHTTGMHIEDPDDFAFHEGTTLTMDRMVVRFDPR